MGTVKGEYIAVKELYGNMDGVVSVAAGLKYNTQVGRRALLNGVIKYDHWITTLSAENFNAPASGGEVKDLVSVQSYGEDVMSEKHNLKVTFSPSTISVNSGTSSKAINVVVTQEGSNNQLNLVCTQAAAADVYTLSHTLNVGTPSAKGGYVQVSVSWTKYKNGSYYTSGTSYPSDISGYASISGAYASGSKVYIPNAGTTTSQPTAYTITSYTFTADGQTYSESGNKAIKLGYNSYYTEYKNYSVSLVSTSDYVAASNELAYITASASKEKYITYDSGSSTYSGTESSKVTLTSSYGLFYSNGSYLSSVTVSSGTQVLFNPNENESSSNRTISVVGKNYDNTSVSKTLNLTQYAAEYYLEIKGVNTIAASGGTLNWTVISTRNDKLYQLTKSNVSVGSGASIQSFSYDDINEDRYSLVLSVGNNSSTSSRYITVTVTQPNGETASRTITQAAASQPSQTITAEVDAYFMDYYTVWFEAFMYTTSGYINEEIYFKVQDGFERYSTVYGEYSYPPPVYDGEFISGEINVSSRFSPMYICVYVGDSLVKYRRIDE